VLLPGILTYAVASLVKKNNLSEEST